MNKKQINQIYLEMKERYCDNPDKILIMNIVKHTLVKVLKSEKIEYGYLELSENIFSENYTERVSIWYVEKESGNLFNLKEIESEFKVLKYETKEFENWVFKDFLKEFYKGVEE